MVLIYLRIESKIPVILMGETGIGKTALIEFLSLLMNTDIFTLNVHSGHTYNEIVEFIENKLEYLNMTVLIKDK